MSKQEIKNSAMKRKTFSLEVEVIEPNLDDLYGKAVDWKKVKQEEKDKIKNSLMETSAMNKFLNAIYKKNTKHIPGYAYQNGAETYLRRVPIIDHSVDEMDLEMITVTGLSQVYTTDFPQALQDIAHNIKHNKPIEYITIEEKHRDYFKGLVEADGTTIKNFGKIIKLKNFYNGINYLPLSWVFTYKEIDNNLKKNNPYLCGVYYQICWERDFGVATKVVSTLLTKRIVDTLEEHWQLSKTFFEKRKQQMEAIKEKEKRIKEGKKKCKK